MRPTAVARILCAALLSALAGQGCGRVSQDAQADSPSSAAHIIAAPSASGGMVADAQTLNQMLERSMNRFARLDLDGDGRVTQEELNTAETTDAANATVPRPASPAFARADANRDGVITREEVQAQTRARFSRLDTNHDGVVTREEMLAGFGRLRPGAAAGDLADGQ